MEKCSGVVQSIVAEYGLSSSPPRLKNQIFSVTETMYLLPETLQKANIPSGIVHFLTITDFHGCHTSAHKLVAKVLLNQWAQIANFWFCLYLSKKSSFDIG